MVNLPKYDRKEMQTLSESEIDKLLSTIKASKVFSRLYPVFLLEFFTGLRRGELLGLRWKDVDFERCQIKRAANKTCWWPL